MFVVEIHQLVQFPGVAAHVVQLHILRYGVAVGRDDPVPWITGVVQRFGDLLHHTGKCHGQIHAFHFLHLFPVIFHAFQHRRIEHIPMKKDRNVLRTTEFAVDDAGRLFHPVLVREEVLLIGINLQPYDPRSDPQGHDQSDHR